MGEAGTTTPGARLEAPEESEALPMPAQQGVGFENEQRVSPLWQATGQEEKGKALGAGEGWPFHVTLQDKELLAEQGIIEQEIGFGAGQIQARPDGEGGMRQLSPAEVTLFEPAHPLRVQSSEEGEEYAIRIL